MAFASTGQLRCETVGGGVDKLHVGFLTIVNSASHSNPLYFDWPVAKKSHQKVVKKNVKKLSQTNKKLCLMATVQCTAL